MEKRRLSAEKAGDREVGGKAGYDERTEKAPPAERFECLFAVESASKKAAA